MTETTLDRRAPFAFAAPDPFVAPGGGAPGPRSLIRIKATGLSRDPESRTYVSRHVGFKLGKFATYIHDLAIRLRNESGPHGAPQFACTVAISLDEGEPIIAERFAPDPRSAFDHALGVMERAVRRTLQRRRHTQR